MNFRKDADEEDKILYIDPDLCIECGACEPACPVQAIYPSEDDVPANQKAFIEINALWYQDKAAARAKVDEHVANCDPCQNTPPDQRQRAH